YVVQFSSNNGTSWTTFTDGVSSSTLATVTGLVNGTAYRFRVAAVTLAGTGAFTAASAAIIPVTAPSAPTNVSGFGGNRLVNLSWSAPASTGGRPIKDYQISFSTDGTNYTVFADGVTAATSATVTGLTNGTTYFFRVRAINEGDMISGFGQSVGIRPFVAAPAPTGLTAVGGDRSVALAWTAPATTQVITDYLIQFRTDVAGSAWQTFVDGTSTTAQAVVTGLTTGTRYFFRVAAVTTTGVGTFTDGTASASPVSAPVVAPTSVRGLGRSGTITLLWDAPATAPAAPVTRYVIQYRTNSAGSVWQTLTISPTTNSAAITGLTNRLGYFFRVAAANGAGVGPWSAESAVIRPY
ncbi:MAG: fibronectin type III domain-containing protein, partial [Actinomycetota bacterium]